MKRDASRFNGVITTGIYCRQGCPATPKQENTRPFEFAAAAEAAGFRPCLRCRPYRSSEPSAWIDSSELVCRAIRLIVAGALDEGTETDLAARLGVSARHLRRLFTEHVGATPDAVARSRRAHFARRLLDETDLPIAHLGYAAGFGSVRQMNRVMQEVFRATPGELRRKRRRGDPLVADAGLELRLPYRAPLDGEALLRYLHARAIPGVEGVEDGWYRRVVRVEGAEPCAGVIELAPAGGADHVVLRAHLPDWDGLIHVVEHARRLLDLDADPAIVASVLRRDPELRHLVRRRPGLRVPGGWDPYELGIRAILGQQISVKAATRLAGRLVQRFGTPVAERHAADLTHLFPEPARLSDTRVSTIAQVGMPEARARTIHAFSRAVVGGLVVLDGSRGLEGTVDELRAIRGVGPWTAQYIAMRACGERDALPASDLGLRRALATNGRLPSAAEIERRAENWRPWRAYAVIHLWTGE